MVAVLRWPVRPLVFQLPCANGRRAGALPSFAAFVLIESLRHRHFENHWNVMKNKVPYTRSIRFFHELYCCHSQFRTEDLHRPTHMWPRTDRHFKVKPYKSPTYLFSLSPLITSISEWNSLPHQITQETKTVAFPKICQDFFHVELLAFFMFILFNNSFNCVLVLRTMPRHVVYSYMNTPGGIKWNEKHLDFL